MITSNNKGITTAVRSLIFIFAFAALTISCNPDTSTPASSPGTTGMDNLSPQAVALMEVIRSPSSDGQSRMEAVYELGELKDPAACRLLIDILRKDMKDRTGIWSAAIPALGNLGDSEGVPVLLDALNDRNDDWLGREMAAHALGQIGNTEAVEALIHSVYFVDTRDVSIRALAKIGNIRATGVLIEALDETENPETVESAEKGLIKIGKAALPELRRELQNHSKEFPNKFRRRAIEKIIETLE